MDKAKNKKLEQLEQSIKTLITTVLDKDNKSGIMRNKFVKLYDQLYMELLKKASESEDEGGIFTKKLDFLITQQKEIQENIETCPLGAAADRVDNEKKRRIHEIHNDIVIKNMENIVDDAIPEKFNDKFSYYPDNIDPEFNNKIYNKPEFKKTEYKSNSKQKTDGPYTLSNSQLFVRNYISEYTPFNGILIWHEVGVGKTCSGISIAENFKKKMYLDGKKTLILTPSETLQQNWRDEIFNIEKELKRINSKKTDTVQCTGSTYYKEEYKLNNNNIDKIKSKVKKDINLYYEFYGYGKLARSIQTDLKHYKIGRKPTQKTLIDYIKKRFSNRVIIMDEVHVIRESGTNKDKKALPYIEMIARYAENSKFILLTATPMYNISKEIILLINLLLWNDKRSPIEEDDIFNKDGIQMKAAAQKQLEEKTRGYISYVRGENPETFPIKLWPSLARTYKPGEDGPLYNKIISHDDEKKAALINVADRINKNADFRLYKNTLDDWQYNRMLRFIEPDEETALINYSAFSTKPTQASNIIFPTVGDSLGEIGETGLEACFDQRDGTYFYEDHVKSIKGKPFLHIDNLGKYSAKFKNIIESIQTCKGICFVFSQYLASGNLALALALEENGFARYDGNNTIRNLLEKDSNRVQFCSVNNKSYEPRELPEDFKQAKYILLDGSMAKTKLNSLVKECRGEGVDNEKGQHIKVILGTRVVEQGISFLNVREVHILDPWHHLNQMKQATGRAIRNYSHRDLDEKERNVTIYLHSAHYGDGQFESNDERIYRRAFFKKKHMTEVERLLKKNAIDCNLNKLNNSRLVQNKLKIIDSKGESRNEDLADKNYSEQCDYAECNERFDCTGDTTVNKESEEGISHSFFSQNEINIIKPIIKKLFEKKLSYTIKEIKENEKVTEYNEDTIYIALSDIINNKEVLYDQYGRSGYLRGIKNIDDTGDEEIYIFQPNELDKDSPMLYRYIPNFRKPKTAVIDYQLRINVRGKKSKIRLSKNTKSEPTAADLAAIFERLEEIYTKDIAKYVDVAYSKDKKSGANYVEKEDKDLPHIPTLGDIRQHLFYSVYENGLNKWDSIMRMHIFKSILEKKIKGEDRTSIEEMIYKYYSRATTIKYILFSKDFDASSKDDEIEGFRWITSTSKYIYKKNRENKLIPLDTGYDYLHFNTKDIEFLTKNTAEIWGFIAVMTVNSEKSNDFAVKEREEGPVKKTKAGKIDKSHLKKGALCSTWQSKTYKADLLAKPYLLGEMHFSAVNAQRQRTPHSNYNDNKKKVQKRTLCQELEIVLRFRDFYFEREAKGKQAQPIKRYFYTYEERLLEIEFEERLLEIELEEEKKKKKK